MSMMLLYQRHLHIPMVLSVIYHVVDVFGGFAFTECKVDFMEVVDSNDESIITSSHESEINSSDESEIEDQ